MTFELLEIVGAALGGLITILLFAWNIVSLIYGRRVFGRRSCRVRQ